MKRFILILAQIVVLASLSACSPQVPATQTPTAITTPCVEPAITLGEIGDQPTQIIPDVQKLANYLAQKLAGFGIECGQVKVTSTVKDMIELINKGEVDVYLDSMFPAALASDATGAEPILRQWRNCDPEYYSVIFTLANSGIGSIDNLPGHVIGVDRPDSTSGFAMPASYLIDRGLRMEVKANWNEPVDANEVGVWFTGADDNTWRNVASGNVIAGATDDFHYAQWEKAEPGKFVVLAKTGSEPRRVVLVRAGLDSALKAAIKNVLLKADQDPNALAVL
ncbi:MAG TPA: phosphate/phosphite/phosphonate ABC transporter substrate-binding protein, partial [Anaerolineales bacterium]|nr:phosphate/phosphite/phosphonate ABC transporter substrate-binding protein [Anaerolineales bacterium]